MTDFSADKLRAFIERADNADTLTRADERFRAERYMWNERAAILAMAEREKRLREMLGSIAGIADAGSHHTDCPDCTEIARIAFGKEKP